MQDTAQLNTQIPMPTEPVVEPTPVDSSTPVASPTPEVDPTSAALSIPSNSQPLSRFYELLRQAGLQEESIAYLSGKLFRAAVEAVLSEVGALFSQEELDQLDSVIDEEEKQAKMAELFEQKKGQTVDEYREQVLEKLVKEFEAAQEE